MLRYDQASRAVALGACRSALERDPISASKGFPYGNTGGGAIFLGGARDTAQAQSFSASAPDVALDRVAGPASNRIPFMTD
jgi:hypothetical protein